MSAEPEERVAPNDAERADHHPVAWLLLVPIVVPLLTFIYNRTEPKLFGFPFYYWCQLAFIALGVLTTTIVYQVTKSRS